MKIAILALAALVLIGCSSPPSESEIVSKFEKTKVDLEVLVRMSEEDYKSQGVIRVADDFTRTTKTWAWPRPEAEWGITKPRWEAYRALFQKASLCCGLSRDGKTNEQIMFPSWAEGLADNSNEYGVLYSPTPVISSESSSQKFTVRKLQGNWYLYHWATW